jgi:hypothetical protein
MWMLLAPVRGGGSATVQRSAGAPLSHVAPWPRALPLCPPLRSSLASVATVPAPSTSLYLLQPPHNPAHLLCTHLQRTPPPTHPTPAGDLAIPLHADATLQDFIVKAELYDRRCSKSWRAGERFRMYFGAKVRAAPAQGGGGPLAAGGCLAGLVASPAGRVLPPAAAAAMWAGDGGTNQLGPVQGHR